MDDKRRDEILDIVGPRSDPRIYCGRHSTVETVSDARQPRREPGGEHYAGSEYLRHAVDGRLLRQFRVPQFDRMFQFGEVQRGLSVENLSADTRRSTIGQRVRTVYQ